MLELSVSQVKEQLSSLLTKTTVVVDKKHKEKKAVIMPYNLYKKLLNKNKESEPDSLDKYVGILSSDFETDDPKYISIKNQK